VINLSFERSLISPDIQPIKTVDIYITGILVKVAFNNHITLTHFNNKKRKKNQSINVIILNYLVYEIRGQLYLSKFMDYV